MFGLWTRAPRRLPSRGRPAPPKIRPTRLFLEALEARECPTPTGGGSGATPPVIANFVAAQQGSFWTFSGTVQDPNLTGLTVHLGGLPEVNNVVVNCDAQGNFTITITLQAGESGIVTALATDSAGLNSALAQATVQPL
jgi:hypothetical protein